MLSEQVVILELTWCNVGTHIMITLRNDFVLKCFHLGENGKCYFQFTINCRMATLCKT